MFGREPDEQYELFQYTRPNLLDKPIVSASALKAMLISAFYGAIGGAASGLLLLRFIGFI